MPGCVRVSVAGTAGWGGVPIGVEPGSGVSSTAEQQTPKNEPKFHGRFLRPKVFLLQNCATLWSAVRMLHRGKPIICGDAQRGENPRKNSVLNYNSAL
jgi:hypothetical protein